MADIKDRAREYLRSQTQLNGGGLFHCNILNLILGFAEQEAKESRSIQEEKLKLLSEYVSDLYVLGYSAKKIAELVQAKIAEAKECLKEE